MTATPQLTETPLSDERIDEVIYSLTDIYGNDIFAPEHCESVTKLCAQARAYNSLHAQIAKAGEGIEEPDHTPACHSDPSGKCICDLDEREAKYVAALRTAWEARGVEMERLRILVVDRDKRYVETLVENAALQSRLAEVEAEREKYIRAKWVEEKEWGYRKAMRVIESNHPRFVVGYRFDLGFLDIATMEGYTVHVEPVTPELKAAIDKQEPGK